MTKITKSPTQGTPLYIHGVRFRGVQVESLAQAVEIWCAYRERTAHGVSKIGNGVKVYDADRKLVAEISYNGRLWDPDGKEIFP